MDEIESQIAKIALGNTKSSSTYVYTMAEKAPVGNTELYVMAELPLINPAAEEDCERICSAIGSTLKRAYRNLPHNEGTFENAIAQINEELGKLASLGQTEWVYKLNAVLAAKEGGDFHIATCGKVSSYLLRAGEFTDISCSQDQSHPLKTFENYASGKLKLGDLLLLSNNQLFNFLSMDRILNILENTPFLAATQTIIQLLKDTGDAQASFGVLMNLQVRPGQINEENVDLENYVVEDHNQENIISKATNYIKGIFALDKLKNRKPNIALPKLSFTERLNNFSGSTKNFLGKTKTAWQATSSTAKALAGGINKDSIKSLNPVKRFFIISVFLLFLAVVISVFVALRVSKNSKTTAEISGQLNKIQVLLDNAQSSLLYKDYTTAGASISQAQALLPSANSVPATNKTQYDKIVSELKTDEQQMEKSVQATVTNLGSLGQGSQLIRLPGYIAVQSGKAIISYNTQNSTIQDNQLNAAGLTVFGSSYLIKNSAAVYDGSNLYTWDFTTSTVSPSFSQDLPSQNDFGGMAYYAVNNRVYILDRKQSRVVNFLNTAKGFSKPIIAFSDPSLSGAQDITIDSAIYVLTATGAEKFQSGKLVSNFNSPQLPTPFSGKGKIYTEKGFKFLYILDAGNNRIIVTDKNGNLQYTIKSDQFTKLADFAVDETNKTIYLLNDGSLLKATLP